MKGKRVLTFCAVIIAATSLTLSLAKGQMSNSLILANIEALSGGECYSGGVGSNACSIAGGITIVGFGISSDCSVSCNANYYACCGIGCECIAIKTN